jgi:diguanylate cyclase (GGDEF)-like protein
MVGGKLHLEFQTGPHTSLKGILVNLPQTDAMLLNLSFGISVVDAVRDYSLTIRNFAPTDLTVEMLYQFEAKNVIMNESRELNQRLQHARLAAEIQASTDALTGLKNRRALDQVLSKMVLSRKVFGLMHLDLDFFKEVNDTFGHAAGDEVLQKASSVLLDETRAGDTVARVGGDEFILVFNDLVDGQRLMTIADRIVTRLEEPLEFQGQTCNISGSVGITTSKFYDIPDADRMLSDADIALYASKHNGRACATMATEDLLRTKTDLAR